MFITLKACHGKKDAIFSSRIYAISHFLLSKWNVFHTAILILKEWSKQFVHNEILLSDLCIRIAMYGIFFSP